MKRYAEAVRVLESDLGKIQGDRAYLEALAQAYRGRITELLASKNEEEARRLFDRLRILDDKVTFQQLRPRPVDDKPKLWVMEVSHVKGAAGGWSTATSMNFKIWHKVSQEKADDMATALERTRRDILKKWLGADDEERWSRLCEVHVYPDAHSFASATGMPTSQPSYFQQKSKAGAIESRLIVTHLDAVGVTDRILPHEAAHATLAGQFGRFAVPRWVDDGIAILSQSPEGADRLMQGLQALDKAGKLYGVRQLMELEFDRAPARKEAYFAQSASLVQVLSTRSGPRGFIEFVRDGLLEGWEKALKRNYGVASYEVLEQRWRRNALFPGIIE